MITAEEPLVAPTGRYSMTETARALGVHRNSLRRWVDGKLIKCGQRRETGRRFFTGTEILRFWRATR